MIKFASHQETVRRAGGYRPWVDKLVRSRWGRGVVDWAPSGDPLYAQILESNWDTKCECGERMVVDVGQPFYCPNCENAVNGYKARPVIFPDNKLQKEIERILVLRPFPQNRNWIAPLETLDDLKQENIDHGIPV